MIKWASFFLVLCAWAADGGCPVPHTYIKEIVVSVKEELRSGCEQSSNISTVKQVIRDKFMPYVDSNIMTKQVLGRKYWFDSSEADRNKLQSLLETLLIKQYAESFSCEYLDNKMEFYPVRGEVGSKAKVDSDVYLATDDPISVKYLMRCCNSGEWKIFDIVVDGLSITQTYRSQFNSLLSQGGIKRLNAYLESKLVK